jgi:hypothetical protein
MLSKKGLRLLAARFDPPPLVRASSAPSGGQRGAACAVGLAAGAGGGLSAPDGSSCSRRSSTMYVDCSCSAGCTLFAIAPTSRAPPSSAPAGAGWRCQLPPTRGGLVGLRSSEASGGGLRHRQQRTAARDCMAWPSTHGGAACPPSSCLSRPPGAQGCQHEPNMAASITCADAKSHLHITGTRANAESRQKCRPCSITWPRVQGGSESAL